MMRLEIPERVGCYRVLRQIAVCRDVGVFEARDEELNRNVTLHWMPDGTDSESRETFLNAARSLAAAHNRHLATVFEVVATDPAPYCVLESFSGGSLADWLTGFPPTIPQTLRIARELAEALVAAELLGLTPMMLQLDRVWLDRPRDGIVSGQPGPPVVKLRDFRAIETGSEETERREALYGLGAILHRMLSETETTRQPMQDDSLPPLRTLAPHAPAALVRCVEELLQAGSENGTAGLTLATAAARLASLERRAAIWRSPLTIAAATAGSIAVVAGLFWFGLRGTSQPRGASAILASDPSPEAGKQSVAKPDVAKLDVAKLDVAKLDVAKPDVAQPDVARSESTPPVASKPNVSTDAEAQPESPTTLPTALPTAPATAPLVLPTVLPTAQLVPAPPKFEPLAPGWREFVQSLSARQQLDAVLVELRRRNPAFGGEARDVHIVDDEIRGFHMPTDQLTDLTPVSVLTDLEWLTCPGTSHHSGALADLTPLSGLKLRTLRAGWTQIRDLRPLAGMPLKELKVGGCQVVDLSPLAGLPIERLEIWGNAIRDLSPLRELRNLRHLRIGHLSVRDLSPLSGLPIETLECEQVTTRNWSPLATLPLVSLRIDFDEALHGDLLRSISTLVEINGKPASELLSP
jgi:hypothetical protein